jgi:hypothetical protein
MALQGPVATTAAHLQVADDDDFAGFSDDEEETTAIEAPAQQRKRGRPPKNMPEPKRQRATPSGGPAAATVGVGIASQGAVGTQVAVGATGQTTRSGRHVKLTEKAADARRA